MKLNGNETTNLDNAPAPAGCELGRPLGDCALRRSGCGSLYQVLTRLYPPPALLAELRARRAAHQDLDPEVVRWLRQLEALTERDPCRTVPSNAYANR